MTLSWTCPECGRRQRFAADEWPDDCVCGCVYHVGGQDDYPLMEEEEYERDE